MSVIFYHFYCLGFASKICVFVFSIYNSRGEGIFFIYSLDWPIATDMCNSELGWKRGRVRVGMVL